MTYSLIEKEEILFENKLNNLLTEGNTNTASIDPRNIALAKEIEQQQLNKNALHWSDRSAIDYEKLRSKHKPKPEEKITDRVAQDITHKYEPEDPLTTQNQIGNHITAGLATALVRPTLNLLQLNKSKLAALPTDAQKRVKRIKQINHKLKQPKKLVIQPLTAPDGKPIKVPATPEAKPKAIVEPSKTKPPPKPTVEPQTTRKAKPRKYKHLRPEQPKVDTAKLASLQAARLERKATFKATLEDARIAYEKKFKKLELRQQKWATDFRKANPHGGNWKSDPIRLHIHREAATLHAEIMDDFRARSPALVAGVSEYTPPKLNAGSPYTMKTASPTLPKPSPVPSAASVKVDIQAITTIQKQSDSVLAHYNEELAKLKGTLAKPSLPTSPSNARLTKSISRMEALLKRAAADSLASSSLANYYDMHLKAVATREIIEAEFSKLAAETSEAIAAERIKQLDLVADAEYKLGRTDNPELQKAKNLLSKATEGTKEWNRLLHQVHALSGAVESSILGASGSYETHAALPEYTRSILDNGLRVKIKKDGSIGATTHVVTGDTASSRLSSLSRPGGYPVGGKHQIIFRFPKGMSSKDVIINDRIPAKYIVGVRDPSTGQITSRADEVKSIKLKDLSPEVLATLNQHQATIVKKQRTLIIAEANIEKFKIAQFKRAATFKYTVISGDTLSEIAKRYNTTVEVLVATNKGAVVSTDPKHGKYGWIDEGAKLIIPVNGEVKLLVPKTIWTKKQINDLLTFEQRANILPDDKVFIGENGSLLTGDPKDPANARYINVTPTPAQINARMKYENIKSIKISKPGDLPKEFIKKYGWHKDAYLVQIADKHGNPRFMLQVDGQPWTRGQSGRPLFISAGQHTELINIFNKMEKPPGLLSKTLGLFTRSITAPGKLIISSTSNLLKMSGRVAMSAAGLGGIKSDIISTIAMITVMEYSTGKMLRNSQDQQNIMRIADQKKLAEKMVKDTNGVVSYDQALEEVRKANTFTNPLWQLSPAQLRGGLGNYVYYLNHYEKMLKDAGKSGKWMDAIGPIQDIAEAFSLDDVITRTMPTTTANGSNFDDMSTSFANMTSNDIKDIPYSDEFVRNNIVSVMLPDGRVFRINPWGLGEPGENGKNNRVNQLGWLGDNTPRTKTEENKQFKNGREAWNAVINSGTVLQVIPLVSEYEEENVHGVMVTKTRKLAIKDQTKDMYTTFMVSEKWREGQFKDVYHNVIDKEVPGGKIWIQQGPPGRGKYMYIPLHEEIEPYLLHQIEHLIPKDWYLDWEPKKSIISTAFPTTTLQGRNQREILERLGNDPEAWLKYNLGTTYNMARTSNDLFKYAGPMTHRQTIDWWKEYRVKNGDCEVNGEIVRDWRITTLKGCSAIKGKMTGIKPPSPKIHTGAYADPLLNRVVDVWDSFKSGTFTDRYIVPWVYSFTPGYSYEPETPTPKVELPFLGNEKGVGKRDGSENWRTKPTPAPVSSPPLPKEPIQGPAGSPSNPYEISHSKKGDEKEPEWENGKEPEWKNKREPTEAEKEELKNIQPHKPELKTGPSVMAGGDIANKGWPTTKQEFLNLTTELASKYGIDARLLRALSRKESGMFIRSKIENGKEIKFLRQGDYTGDETLGIAGAWGLFHVRKETGGKAAAIDDYNQRHDTKITWQMAARDPLLAAHIGAEHFADLYKGFVGSHGARNATFQAYAAYNGGPDWENGETRRRRDCKNKTNKGETCTVEYRANMFRDFVYSISESKKYSKKSSILEGIALAA